MIIIMTSTMAKLIDSWNSSQIAYNSGRTSISGGQVIEPAIINNGLIIGSDSNDNNPPDTISPFKLYNSIFGASSPGNNAPHSKRLYLRYNEILLISSNSSGVVKYNGAALKI